MLLKVSQLVRPKLTRRRRYCSRIGTPSSAARKTRMPKTTSGKVRSLSTGGTCCSSYAPSFKRSRLKLEHQCDTERTKTKAQKEPLTSIASLRDGEAYSRSLVRNLVRSCERHRQRHHHFILRHLRRRRCFSVKFIYLCFLF